MKALNVSSQSVADVAHESLIGWLWPGPEILAINLIAENQPFDTTWHEKFRCNRHGRLMLVTACRVIRFPAAKLSSNLSHLGLCVDHAAPRIGLTTASFCTVAQYTANSSRFASGDRNDIRCIGASQQIKALTKQSPRFTHLIFVAVSLVNALDLIFLGVVKATFSDLRQYMQHRHHRCAGAPQIVRRPFPSRQGKSVGGAAATTHRAG